MDGKIKELLALMTARHETYVIARASGFTVGVDAWRMANRKYVEAQLALKAAA
jgi:hypothetical protein